MLELDGIEVVLKTLTAQEEQVIRLRFAIGIPSLFLVDECKLPLYYTPVNNI